MLVVVRLHFSIWQCEVPVMTTRLASRTVIGNTCPRAASEAFVEARFFSGCSLAFFGSNSIESIGTANGRSSSAM